MVNVMTTSKEQILEYLEEVKDPEIPVLNIVEMGIVADVDVDAEPVRVDITPTYSGCPAMKAIQDEIVSTLRSKGVGEVQVNQIYSPPWTTDWMTEEAKRKLREYGIAAPPKTTGAELNPLTVESDPLPCPQCGSTDTELRSAFGSTPCKAFHFCRACLEPFEAFKAI